MHIIISPQIIDKIESKHNVYEEEVREVFKNPDDRPETRRSRRGRYTTFGRTLAGRYLMVAFSKTGNTIRVITARDMPQAEKRHYQRR